MVKKQKASYDKELEDIREENLRLDKESERIDKKIKAQALREKKLKELEKNMTNVTIRLRKSS